MRKYEEKHIRSSFNFYQLAAKSKLKKTYHIEDILIISPSYRKEAVSIVYHVLCLDKDTYTVNVDFIRFKYVVLAKY